MLREDETVGVELSGFIRAESGREGADAEVFLTLLSLSRAEDRVFHVVS